MRPPVADGVGGTVNVHILGMSTRGTRCSRVLIGLCIGHAHM